KSTASATQPIRGGSLTVRTTATDDVAVASVGFFVNGQLVFTSTTTPYQYTLTVPPTGSTVTIGVTATDFGGNSAPTSITLTTIPDPLTTVTGRVIDPNSAPVAGATVTTLNRSATSGANGAFAITGVPTVSGNITVTATAIVAGVTLGGVSTAVTPVAGGTTNVGDIRISAAISYLPFDDGINPTADIAGGHNGTLMGATFTTSDIAPVAGNVSSLLFNG